MPEIAEVALMAKAVSDVCLGRQITEIDILGGRYLKKPLEDLDKLKAKLPLVVKDVKTKGKRCWLELTKDSEVHLKLNDLKEVASSSVAESTWWILISFGMSGAIYYEPTDTEIAQARIRLNKPGLTRSDYMKFYHIRVTVDGEVGFYFGDMRQFGSWKLFQNRAGLDSIIGNLGPDMLTGPPISDAEFINIFRGWRFCNKNICKVLMSQEAISGVGNYIKAEVLYRCRIHPEALISNLSDQNLIELHKTIKIVAQSAFDGSGASLYTFTGSRQEKGAFQKLLLVYNQEFDPFGNAVVRLKTYDQRTTHWVPAIQIIGDPKLVSVPKIKLNVPMPKLK